MNGPPALIIFGAAIRRDGTPSDTLRARVAAAVRLGRTLHDPTFVPTGGIGRHGASEASVMAALLREAGVDSSRIRMDETARNTIRSVQACRRLVAGCGPVHAVSSAYHVPRCVMLLRIAGIRARGHAPGSSFRAFPALREAVAFPVDFVTALAWRWAGRL